MNVIDLGAFPAVDYSYLWLTICGPIGLFIIICTVVNKSRLSDDNQAATIFLSCFGLLLFAVLGSILWGEHLEEVRWDAIYQSVEKAGYSDVMVLEPDQGAVLSAVDEDGKGVLLNFAELPDSHVGVLEVEVSGE